MASIEWIANSLYPAGYYVRDIPIQATLKVPDGWHVATALRPESGAGSSTLTYPVTTYEILMDSPAIAGAHYRRIALSPDVSLDVIADTEDQLAASYELIALNR